MLICEKCKTRFEKPRKEYMRWARKGRNRFYCCQSCASLSVNTKHTEIERKCLWCKNSFKSTTHKRHRLCCSQECASKRSQSFVDQAKLSKTMRRLYSEGKINAPSCRGIYRRTPAQWRTPKQCPHCKNQFIGRSKYCSRECIRKMQRKHLTEYQKYKRECQFRFNLKDYPDEFDFSLLSEHGMYKAKNHGNNLGGVSRDHIISIAWGHKHGIDPEMISHPANCRLILQVDNSRKHSKSLMTAENLTEKIKIWDFKYPNS